MDSKSVSAELKREIRPLLTDRGFRKFTSRYAWRLHDDRVDVVNFQSFSDFKARSLGCTSYSFAVNLGCYLRRIDGTPIFSKVAVSEGRLPREYQCQFRGTLERTFDQPELSRRDIWYVDPDGRYLAKAAHDVRMVLAGQGLDWFDTFQDESRVLRILRDGAESKSLWGFGAPGSPARLRLLDQLSTKA
jgi:Domain of unknown function (DUF4304)